MPDGMDIMVDLQPIFSNKDFPQILQFVVSITLWAGFFLPLFTPFRQL
jgi:hypothetical protein